MPTKEEQLEMKKLTLSLQTVVEEVTRRVLHGLEDLVVDEIENALSYVEEYFNEEYFDVRTTVEENVRAAIIEELGGRK